jgi:long-subunit acyl-CoA synthetase (AMP-forming)
MSSTGKYLFQNKLKQMLGLDKARLTLTAAAALPQKTRDFFAALDIPL